MGVEVEKFIPEFDPNLLWHSWLTLRSWSVSNGMRDLYKDKSKRDLLKPEVIYEIESGLALSATQVYEASVVRSNWFQYLTKVFTKYDALALPSAQVFPFKVETNWPNKINDVEMSTYHQWMEVVIPVSLVGLPAINIPCGFNNENLPMGLQLFGAQGNDKLMFQFAQNYHLVTDWPNQKRPFL
jgi:amidase